MNWRLLVYLSLFGLAMSFATLQFIPFNFEMILWVFIVGFSGYSIGKAVEQQAFLNGFVLGVIQAIYLVAFRVAFLNSYQSGHTEIIARFPSDVNQRMIIAAMAVGTGIVVGLLTGVMAAWVSKSSRKSSV